MQKELISLILWTASLSAQSFPPSGGSAAPSGTIAWFRVACPAGWSEYTAARGRYVVGVPAGGTVEAVVGNALSNQENRDVAQHTHDFIQLTHRHTVIIDWHTHTIPNAYPSQYVTSSGSGVQVQKADSTGYTTNTHGTTLQTTGSASPTITIQSAGSVPGTIAPYIQLYVCRKN